MTLRTRLLSAALVVTVAAGGAAAYAQHLPAAAASAPLTSIVVGSGTTALVGGLDLSAFMGGTDPDRRLIRLAYDRVQRAYYKPVADQMLIAGERKGLLSYLNAREVKNPQVPANSATGDPARDLRVLETTLSSTQQRYAKVAARDELTQAALMGMLNGLGDPYTTYMTPREIKSLDESLRGGNFGGVGVYIVQDPKTKDVLAQPIEGNPAIRAGVRTGDTIVAVDGKPVRGKKLDEVERAIRGPIGSVVALTVKAKDAGERTVRVTRAEIHVPSVAAKIENGIAYVRLADFGSSSAEEVRKAMLDAKHKGVHGYVLDLRNNGGGLLDAAVDVSSLFLPSGQAVVSTIDRAGSRETRTSGGGAIDAKPLVILVNKYTASASEITAGALQDYGVATLLGEKTFGKGVVQSLYTMPDKGALKITTARYVTPKGRDIHHKGIVPDVVVQQRVDLPIIDTPRDVQLAAAKKLIDHKDQP